VPGSEASEGQSSASDQLSSGGSHLLCVSLLLSVDVLLSAELLLPSGVLLPADMPCTRLPCSADHYSQAL
jgi:hypothetical protein